MITMLQHLKKVVEPPSKYPRQYIIVWARKLFPDKDIYELSLEDIEHLGSYTGWYVKISDDIFEWISCSMRATIETLAIRAALEIKDEIT